MPERHRKDAAQAARLPPADPVGQAEDLAAPLREQAAPLREQAAPLREQAAPLRGHAK